MDVDDGDHYSRCIGVGITTSQMVIAQSITLAIIVLLIIPTLYFVIRKANDRRGYGPAIIIGIGLPLIAITVYIN